MKKPEITEGEWVYCKGQITEQEGYAIAEYVSEHDGQAISAVPEMIDALIEVYRALECDYSKDYIFEDSLNENSHLGKITLTVNDVRNIINALEKAGVEL